MSRRHQKHSVASSKAKAGEQKSQSKYLPSIREESPVKIPLASDVLVAKTAWSQGPPRSASDSVSVSAKAPVSGLKSAPPFPRAEPEPAPAPPTLTPEELAAAQEAAMAPWPEFDDFGTPPSRYETPKPTLSQEQIQMFGDKIVRLINAEVKMCRTLEVKVPQTYIRLYPSPPYEPALNVYVVEKATTQALVEDVVWDFGRDVITIVF